MDEEFGRRLEDLGVPDNEIARLMKEAERPLPLHRTEAGYPRCATCDGGGCPDCTDPA